MEDLFLNVTLAALQDRENGIKTFAKKSVLSKKVKLCFYGAQFTETLRTFGIEDKMKTLEIGQRLLDAGYISPFEAKDRALAMQEGSVYFWGEVVVMESKVIEANFTSALHYFVEHPYKRSQSASTSNQASSSVDETLSKAGTGLLKRLRGLVDEPSAPAPAATVTTMSTRRGEKSQGGSPAPQPAATPTVASLSPTAAASPQEATGPDTVEEDTDEIKFFLSPDDPNPVVKAATLDKLIERLTYEAYIDMRFRHQFLITYRSFTTPLVLLEKLRERFNSVPATPPTDPTERTEWERQRKLIHLRVLTVLSRWITDLYEDWNDAELRNALSSFLDEAPSNVAPLCNQIRALLTKPQNADGDRWLLETTPGGPATFSFEDAAVPDIAQQLTAYEFQLFIAIQRDEFLGLKWSKPGKNERAKNVLRYINHFNRVSNWVVREIITCFQLNKRSKLVLKFVQLAFKFREYNNFSSSMCILAALVSSPVRRLKATWAEVPPEWQEKMSSLETLFAHNMSYKAYRETIQKLVPPCIPYLGLYLTDLTFIEEANKDKLDTLINFQKRIMISKVIEDIRRFQGVPYKNFTLTNAVKNWLQSLPVFSTDEEAYQLSLKIEPRNAAVTLESMLVEEDRLRKLLHEREIRISDLESENQRLKEQLALLDADLRTQIRRGTDASDDGPPVADGNIARRSGNRSFGRLTLNVSTIPFHRAKPTIASSDAAAEAQGSAEEHLPIPKKSSSSEVSAPGWPAKAGSRVGERPLNDSGVRPLNELGSRPLNDSGIRPLNESGVRALRESPKGDASPPAATLPGSISNRNSPARLVLSQDPSADASPDGSALAAATPPPVAVSPKRPPPLPTSNAVWSSAPAALPSPTSASEPAPTGSPRGKVLPPSAPNPHSISPRERPTPSPYPGFDLPPPDIAPPAPPPDEGPATSPARSPRDAENDADAHLRSVADALEKPGNRFGRVVRRQDTSPTPGSEPAAPGAPSSGSPSHSQRGVPQVSPASQGKRLPPVPAARKMPSSAAPQLPRFDSTRTGSPAPTQQP